MRPKSLHVRSSPKNVRVNQRFASIGVDYEEVFEDTDSGRRGARIERHLLQAFALLVTPEPNRLGSDAVYLMSRIMRIHKLLQVRMGVLSNSALREQKLQQEVLDRAIENETSPPARRRRPKKR